MTGTVSECIDMWRGWKVVCDSDAKREAQEEPIPLANSRRHQISSSVCPLDPKLGPIPNFMSRTGFAARHSPPRCFVRARFPGRRLVSDDPCGLHRRTMLSANWPSMERVLWCSLGPTSWTKPGRPFFPGPRSAMTTTFVGHGRAFIYSILFMFHIPC
jgi:hypothetical protein